MKHFECPELVEVSSNSFVTDSNTLKNWQAYFQFVVS